jgi:hypothetical protein
MSDEEHLEPSTEELLDGIPGAFEPAQIARDQARRGEIVPLEALNAQTLGAADNE